MIAHEATCAGQKRPAHPQACEHVFPAPKLLRIGVFKDGHVVDERLIEQRANVTVGTSRKATFVVHASNCPAPFKLFERIGGDYVLNFLDGMSGCVAMPAGLADLASLKDEAHRVGPAYQVKIPDDARGRIVIGDATFLFQFVEVPRIAERIQLSRAVQGGLASRFDWSFAAFAAVTFALHFGAVAASAHWDPEVSDGVTVGLIEMAATSAVKGDGEEKNESATLVDPKPPIEAVEHSTVGPEFADGIVPDPTFAIANLGARGGPNGSGMVHRSREATADVSRLGATWLGATTLWSKSKKPPMLGAHYLVQVKAHSRHSESVLASSATSTPAVVDLVTSLESLERRVYSCYKEASDANPTIAGQGRVDLTFEVGSSGSVESMKIRHSGIGRAVSKCIVDEAQNAFVPESGISVKVSYTLRRKWEWQEEYKACVSDLDQIRDLP